MSSLDVFLARDLGVDSKFFSKIAEEDDWSFIIKLHALLEGALNHVLSAHFRDKRLFEVFRRIEMSAKHKGKAAIAHALDIITKEEMAFLFKLSEIRNCAAHEIENLNLDIKDWLETEFEGLASFRKGMNTICAQPINGTEGLDTKALAVENPKSVIWLTAMVITVKTKLYAESVLAALQKGVLAQPPESIPKESE